MVSMVAAVTFDKDVQASFEQALRLIGGVHDLNTTERPVVVKVGVFNHKEETSSGRPTVGVVSAVVNSFNKAPRVFLAESDNYVGTGSERLQLYEKAFTDRVVPFNLSTDTDTREVQIGDEKISLSNMLFDPSVFVSIHAPRRFDRGGPLSRMNVGSVLKNLLGLIPDRKKARFHENLITVLLDTYEAIGGIDLAVLDGTYTHLGADRIYRKIETKFLLVGRNAIAVEAVGASLVGLDPEKMPLIQEAVGRGLSEGNPEEIEVLGTDLESLERKLSLARSELGLQQERVTNSVCTS